MVVYVLQQCHALRHHHLGAADLTDAFARFGLQSDLCWRNGQQFRDASPYCEVMGNEFRLLGEHNAVQVDNTKSSVLHLAVRQLQHFCGIPVPVRRIGIRKQLANITLSSGTQQRVCHGMQQHVGVTMSQQVAIVGYFNATKPQGTAVCQTMCIVPDSNT